MIVTTPYASNMPLSIARGMTTAGLITDHTKIVDVNRTKFLLNNVQVVSTNNSISGSAPTVTSAGTRYISKYIGGNLYEFIYLTGVRKFMAFGSGAKTYGRGQITAGACTFTDSANSFTPDSTSEIFIDLFASGLSNRVFVVSWLSNRLYFYIINQSNGGFIDKRSMPCQWSTSKNLLIVMDHDGLRLRILSQTSSTVYNYAFWMDDNMEGELLSTGSFTPTLSHTVGWWLRPRISNEFETYHMLAFLKNSGSFLNINPSDQSIRSALYISTGGGTITDGVAFSSCKSLVSERYAYVFGVFNNAEIACLRINTYNAYTTGITTIRQSILSPSVPSGATLKILTSYWWSQAYPGCVAVLENGTSKTFYWLSVNRDNTSHWTDATYSATMSGSNSEEIDGFWSYNRSNMMCFVTVFEHGGSRDILTLGNATLPASVDSSRLSIYAHLNHEFNNGHK